MIKQIQLVDNQVQVILQGDLFVEEVVTMRETLFGYIENGHAIFLIDFSAVDYIDRTGLGTLLALQKRALQHGGSVTIKGLHGLVKDLFEMTRLNKVFDIQ